MSIYDNNKVYSTYPSAPEDSDTAQKISDFRKLVRWRNFSLDEMEKREKLAKNG